MVSLTAVGFETGAGVVVCRACAGDSELLHVHRVGELIAPIVRPSRNGQYCPSLESRHYDEPCGLCGWPIR